MPYTVNTRDYLMLGEADKEHLGLRAGGVAVRAVANFSSVG